MSTTSSAEATILHDVTDGTATLTLNRPDTGNLFDATMARDLRRAATDLAGRDDVRVIVLRGAGRAFCMGGDIGFFQGSGDPAAVLDGMADDLHAALAALHGGDAPVVAVVQGAAFGVGLSLAAFADVVLAADSARFLAGYPGVGLSPDGGLTWSLPRKVGAARAAALLLTGRRLSAAEALEAGRVSEVVPADELQDAAARVAATVAAGPTGAFGEIRRLLAAGSTASLAEHLDAERAALVRQAGGPEGREGIAAFTEGRRPRFAPAVAEAGA